MFRQIFHFHRRFTTLFGLSKVSFSYQLDAICNSSFYLSEISLLLFRKTLLLSFRKLLNSFLAPDSMKFQALKHPSMLSLLHQHPNGYKLFIVCRLFQLEPQTLIKVEMTKFYRGFFVFWKKECFTHMCRKPIVLIFPAFLFLKSPDSSRQCHLAFAAAQFAQHFSSGKEKNFSDMRQWLAWEQ